MVYSNLVFEIISILVPLALGGWIVWSIATKIDTEKLFFGFVANVAICYCVKYLFAIPRSPFIIGPVVVFEPAMPSLHVQAAVFIAVFAYLAYKEGPKLKRHGSIKAEVFLLSVIAGLVAVSRVVIGAHDPYQVIAGALFGGIIAVVFYRWKMRDISRVELRRQGVHFSGFLLVLFALAFGTHAGAVASFLCCIAMYVLITSRRMKGIVGLFRRKDETPRGPMLYFLSIGLVLFFFPQAIAFAAILALTVGDTATALYGKRFGRVHLQWPFNPNKTLEGACFGFISVFAVLSLLSSVFHDVAGKLVPVFFNFSLSVVIVVSLIAVVVEALEHRDRDNFLIPVMVAIFLYSIPFVVG